MLKEPEMTDIIRHLLKEVLILTGIKPFKRRGMSITQPTQTLGLNALIISSRQLIIEFLQIYKN